MWVTSIMGVGAEEGVPCKAIVSHSFVPDRHSSLEASP